MRKEGDGVAGGEGGAGRGRERGEGGAREAGGGGERFQRSGRDLESEREVVVLFGGESYRKGYDYHNDLWMLEPPLL